MFYRHEMAVKMQCLVRRRAARRERRRRQREKGYWGDGVPGYALVLESAGSVVKVGGIAGCRVALFIKEYSVEDHFERVAPQAAPDGDKAGDKGGGGVSKARRHALCRAVLDIVEKSCDTSRLDELFAKVDADGNRAVDADEFAGFVAGAGMLSGAAPLSKEELGVVFRFMDTSGNGVVEVEEFRAFFFQEVTNRRAVIKVLDDRNKVFKLNTSTTAIQQPVDRNFTAEHLIVHNESAALPRLHSYEYGLDAHGRSVALRSINLTGCCGG